MPIDAATAGTAGGAATGFTTGASAAAARAAKDARAATKLSEEQKQAMFLEKMNKGRKLDKEPVTAENQGKLGKDDFMKLMIATLKYQDPTAPMDTQKLLEQTSIMTNMEQMIKMTQASQQSFEAQQRAQGSNMVGKTIVYDGVDSQGNAVTTAGKVDAIEFFAAGKVVLHVGKDKVPMEKVLGIADASNGPAAAGKWTDEVDKGAKIIGAGEKPAADKPVADKPAADKPAADKPVADKPAADKPVADKSTADKPAAEAAVSTNTTAAATASVTDPNTIAAQGSAGAKTEDEN